ncbi:hypothetical protein [Streptomyces sp. HD]|uniref:hypothetical protein n=1 Tax=Streptomyces sp. HD TaxID=3020892 RepID=UPI00232B1745|nr:hypothetical protein [Streptomyces sp. HD]MDC0768579.1 hypothetical protein [Streptomyces sp. HD]
MTATAGSRNGRVRVLVVDDEHALTDVPDGMQRGLLRRARGERSRTDSSRTPLRHAVRGPSCTIGPVEDGR